MKEVKEMKIENLENITGGSGLERKELIDFIKEYYPDVKTNNPLELSKFFKSVGIVDVIYHPNVPNIYKDVDGKELTQKQFIELLKKNLIK